MQARTILLIAFLAVAAVSVKPSGAPWERAFADAATVLKAAQEIVTPEGQPINILLDSYHYTVDSAGRTSATIRRVYRVLNEDGVEEWASLEHPYAPWHENRPVFRARIIRADRSVHWLDAKTIADSPVREFDNRIYSDNRVLRAPLPAVAVGAVVEYEITTRETAPMLDAGVVRHVEISDYVPVQRVNVIVEAARGIQLRAAHRNVRDSAMRRDDSGGATRVEWNIGPLAAREIWVSNLPYDVSATPSVWFSTGVSWRAVAARYEAIVNRQIQGADVKAMVADAGSGTPLEIATRLTARLHQEIRYTGVEFGEAAIVPRTPAEVLQRKYGDCKDKAALLVAMLRGAGLRADIALLNAGFSADVEPELPGLGAFNHAIVRVASEPPIWIDATSPETRVGDLPLPDQGRLALIANGESAGLIKTVSFPASHNWRKHTIEVRMSEFGSGEFHETIEAAGQLETSLRQTYDPANEKNAREALQNYVKQTFQAKSLGPFTIPPANDFGAPFRMKLQALHARSALTQQDDAAAVMHPYLVFDELPYQLTGAIEDEPEQKAKPRQHDFLITLPHQLEYRYLVRPPKTFRPQRLPDSRDVPMGTARFTQDYRKLDDGSVEAVFRFDSGKARLTPEEFEALRSAIQRQLVRQPEAIVFVSEAAEMLALGHTAKAVKLVREVAADPANLGAQIRMTRMLVTAGAGEGAVELGKKIIATAPDSPAAWQALSWAYQHDRFGRRFRGGWNRSEAVRCLREAVRLDPDDPIARVDLAILLEHNERGERYKKGAELDEAIELYRSSVKQLGPGQIQNNLAVALLQARRFAEAREELKNLPPNESLQLSVLLTALTDGPSRAIIESQSPALDARMRARLLTLAAQSLLGFREYARAAELTRAATRVAGSSSMNRFLETLEKAKRHEEIQVEPTDPRWPLHQLMIHAIASPPDLQKIKALHSRLVRWETVSTQLGAFSSPSDRALSGLVGIGMDLESLVDIGLAIAEIDAKGDDKRGYRVSMAGEVAYVVQEDGQFKILGYKSAAAAVGELVLELLARGDLASAQWWLDTVVGDLTAERNLAGPAVRFLWAGVNDESRGADAARLAAASLIGMHSGSEQAVKILEAARLKAPIAMVQGQIDLALCETHNRAKRWKELLATARRLGTHKTFETDSFEFVVRAATGLNQWETVKAAARPRLSRPFSAPAQRALAQACMNSGEYDCADKYWSMMDTFLEENDRVQRVWNRMLMGKADEELLQELTKSAGALGDFGGADLWYTLGMLQLALNRADDAHRSLTRAVEKDSREEPSDARALLHGGVLHAFGLNEAAKLAFARAGEPRPGDEVGKWAAVFVKKSAPTGTVAGP